MVTEQDCCEYLNASFHLGNQNKPNLSNYKATGHMHNQESNDKCAGLHIWMTETTSEEHSTIRTLSCIPSSEVLCETSLSGPSLPRLLSKAMNELKF